MPNRPGVTPYFSVRNGAEALKWYAKALGAKTEVFMKSSDGKIVHAELRINGGSFFVSDEFPEYSAYCPLHYNGTTAKFIIYSKDCDKALAKCMSAGGAQVLMPATDQFWGERTCKIRDPYGHEWCFTQTLKVMSQRQLNAAWAGIEKSMNDAAATAADSVKTPASGKSAEKVPAKKVLKTGAAKKTPEKVPLKKAAKKAPPKKIKK
jgi:PhnB protein